MSRSLYSFTPTTTTRLRTLRLSATGSRTLATLIATTAGSGGGSFQRIFKYYKLNNIPLKLNPSLAYGFKPSFP